MSPTTFDNTGEDSTIGVASLDSFTISKLKAGWFTKNKIVNNIIYASATPTIKPRIFDGIPRIIVNFRIFSKTPVIFINTASIAENKHIKSIKAIN